MVNPQDKQVPAYHLMHTVQLGECAGLRHWNTPSTCSQENTCTVNNTSLRNSLPTVKICQISKSTHTPPYAEVMSGIWSEISYPQPQYQMKFSRHASFHNNYYACLSVGVCWQKSTGNLFDLNDWAGIVSRPSIVNTAWSSGRLIYFSMETQT